MIDKKSLERKIRALQILCEILSKKEINDVTLFAMVEAFNEVSAEDVETAVKWNIKYGTSLPTPSEMIEGITNGQYQLKEKISVTLTPEERIALYWKQDMGDCGIDDEEEYKKHIKRWEEENPGLNYYDEIIKRDY